jgi:hypothetical protein
MQWTAPKASEKIQASFWAPFHLLEVAEGPEAGKEFPLSAGKAKIFTRAAEALPVFQSPAKGIPTC